VKVCSPSLHHRFWKKGTKKGRLRGRHRQNSAIRRNAFEKFNSQNDVTSYTHQDETKLKSDFLTI
jgi:hypothetical protein